MRSSQLPASRLSVVFACAALGVASYAFANVGIGLPLDDYEVGSEQTNSTIVPNGGFEAVTAGVPNGWTQNNSFGVGSAIGPNSQTTGNFVAQGPLGAPDQNFPAINGYTRSVTLDPSTTYVLSAYMWNFGENFDLAVVELRDAIGVVTNANVILTRSFPSQQDPTLNLDGSRGVFGYSGFNSGAGGTFNLVVKWDKDSGVADPNIGIQVDNVAITPLGQFQAPRVPEPMGLSLLGVGLIGLLRRR